MAAPAHNQEWGIVTSSELALSDALPLDSYFLDAQSAINYALQSNTITDSNGHERLQLCYYDGDPVDGAPLNLINVPSSAYSTFFATFSLPLPQRVVCGAGQSSEYICAIETAFKEMNQSIVELREKNIHPLLRIPVFQDSYFLDPRIAFHTALQKNRVWLLHPTISGLQVCYYDGEVLEGAPDNLINVKLENALNYFSTCATRLPSQIVLPPIMDAENKLAIELTFIELMQQVKENRSQNINSLSHMLSERKPKRVNGEKPRVLLPTSRVTTVMQHVTKNIAHAFEKRGFETLICIESSDMELMDQHRHYSELLKFDPHIVFNVNYLDNTNLHEDIYNIVWYQDPMREISQDHSLTLRSRDIMVGLPDCCELLKQRGARNVLMAHHCVNTDKFRNNTEVARQHKIVFAGTNGEDYDKIQPEMINAVESAKTLIYALIDSDRPITHGEFDSIAEETGLSRKTIYNRLFYLCVRNRTIRWLCQQNELPVEIYGAGWDTDPVIAPFAKGIVAYNQLAGIYASAKYAFIPAADNLHLQRLGEVAASGCIPVCFDIRNLTAPPLWENEVLYFRNPQQLKQQLQQQPKSNPYAIAEAMSCDRLLSAIFSFISSQHSDFAELIKNTQQLSE